MKRELLCVCAIVGVVGACHSAQAAWTHFQWTGVPVGDGGAPTGFDSVRLDLYLDMATFDVAGKKINKTYTEIRFFKGATATTFVAPVGVSDYFLDLSGFWPSYNILPRERPAGSDWTFAIFLDQSPNQPPWTSASPQAFLAATTSAGAHLSVIMLGPYFWPGMNAANPATVTSDVPPPLVPSTGVVPALLGGYALAARRRR